MRFSPNADTFETRKEQKRTMLKEVRDMEQARHGAILLHTSTAADSEDTAMQGPSVGSTVIGTAFHHSKPNLMSASPPDIDSHHRSMATPYYMISSNDDDEASDMRYIGPSSDRTPSMQPQETIPQALATVLPSFDGPIPALNIPIARTYRGKAPRMRSEVPKMASHLNSVLLQPVR